MSAKPIPETANRQDWPRLVALANKDHEGRIKTLEAGGGGGGGVTDGDKGDITVSGTGTVWTLDNDTVTNAKLANVATATLKGRVTGGTGDPEDLTGTQATTLLDAFTSGLKGLAPASGGGTVNFLRADGSWAAPASLAGTATVTVPNSRVEWEETVTATGVTGASKIVSSLAPTVDSDENSADLLPAFTLAGTPGTNQITFLMAFNEPVAGPVKLNWSAF